MRLLRRGLTRREAAKASVQWLVIGLGNPGPRYASTRHNLGREAVLRLAARNSVGLSELRFNSRFGRGQIAGQKVCLGTPTTYMNDSGQAVASLARFYYIAPDHVLLAFDDLDLPLGTVRVRPAGSPGGHNGVASVLQSLGTNDVPRVRIGIGRPPAGWEPADYVLSRFRDEELEQAELSANRAAEAAECVLGEGLDAAMNRYN